MCLLPFLDLLQSSDAPLAAVERRGEVRAHELRGELGPHDFTTQAEHVHVVVLDALVRGVRVVADRGADAGDLRRGDRRALTWQRRDLLFYRGFFGGVAVLLYFLAIDHIPVG